MCILIYPSTLHCSLLSLEDLRKRTQHVCPPIAIKHVGRHASGKNSTFIRYEINSFILPFHSLCFNPYNNILFFNNKFNNFITKNIHRQLLNFLLLFIFNYSIFTLFYTKTNLDPKLRLYQAS